jgi:hypothetical protein
MLPEHAVHDGVHFGADAENRKRFMTLRGVPQA